MNSYSHHLFPFAIQRLVMNEHGDVRLHSIAHHIGNPQSAPVRVLDALNRAIISDADENCAAVPVRKSDDFFLDIILRDGF